MASKKRDLAGGFGRLAGLHWGCRLNRARPTEAESEIPRAVKGRVIENTSADASEISAGNDGRKIMSKLRHRHVLAGNDTVDNQHLPGDSQGIRCDFPARPVSAFGFVASSVKPGMERSSILWTMESKRSVSSERNLQTEARSDPQSKAR